MLTASAVPPEKNIVVAAVSVVGIILVTALLLRFGHVHPGKRQSLWWLLAPAFLPGHRCLCQRGPERPLTRIPGERGLRAWLCVSTGFRRASWTPCLWFRAAGFGVSWSGPSWPLKTLQIRPHAASYAEVTERRRDSL